VPGMSCLRVLVLELSPKDDRVLELAVSAGCTIIVTYNKDDFEGVEKFGSRLLTAQQFLRQIGELP
jgi:predicted nucleic acid-binding protein